jgi:rod shape-determining protein MreD
MGSGVFIMAGLLSGVAALLSYFGQLIAIRGVQPDLVLLLLVFYANSEGSYRAQGTGIIVGLVEDFMSLAPLGFHLLLRATVGLLFGQSRNKIFLDPFIMPALMVFAAMAVKALYGLIIGGIFGIESVTEHVLSVSYLIEVGYNVLLAPLLFLFYGLMKPLVGTRGIRVLG